MSNDQKTQPAIKTLTAQCYCKTVHFTIDIPASYLPLKVNICHCSACRYGNGTLCIFQAALPTGVAPSFVAPSSLSSLKTYRHTDASSRRHFCSTCSCHIADVGISDGQWIVSASIFDANKYDVPAVWDIPQHVNADGAGLHDWLPRISGKELKIVKTEKAEAPVVPEQASDGKSVRVECLCGGVSFAISRPAPEDKGYENWVSPLDPGKWKACLDACNDCRLQTGVHTTGWAYVPESRIAPGIPGDLKIGTSETYRSSEHLRRSFCGVCGASVLGCFIDDSRKLANGDRLIVVSVGLMRAPDGSLAEDWLTWITERCGGYMDIEKTYDPALTRALDAGLLNWGNEKYGEVVPFKFG